MSRFNLIDEEWIPVRFSDGKRGRLGIRETLLNASEIAEIEDTSPLVVVGLHRFLLAVLYRALNTPCDIVDSKTILINGISREKLMGYLEKWRSRFWLFDEKHPFFQIPEYDPILKNGKKQWRTWPAIAAEHNADNAKILFDHVDITRPEPIDFGRAACWLIACQVFALGGGNSDFKYTKSAPSATAVMALPIGNNLHDTLIFSLIPENRDIAEFDLPIWERDAESISELKKGVNRNICGFSDLYTWRTRSIKLRQFEDSACIKELTFASGIDCTDSSIADPMLAYRLDEKKGIMPIQFKERGLWRDFDSLLPDAEKLAPRVIAHSVKLAQFDKARFPKSIMVFGQANKKAKIKYWRMERFALPEALSGNRNIRSEIHQILSDAKEAQKSLWAACCVFAREMLSRGEREPEEKDINNFIDQMPVNSLYWSDLESQFHDVLGGYTIEMDPDDIRLEWLKSVRETLRKVWRHHSASIATGDAWGIRALVKADAPVKKRLGLLNAEIRKLELSKEGA